MKINEIKPIEATNYLRFTNNKNEQHEKKEKEIKKEIKDVFDNMLKECMKQYE